MATVKEIQDALVTAYAGISLPNSLGTPTAVAGETDGNPTALPFVEVYRNPTQSIIQTDEDSYIITRLFIVRLYTAKLNTDTPSVNATNMNNASDCIETVEDYFYFTDDRIGRTGDVIDNIMTADTGSTTLFTRNNDTYAGVAFEHTVRYIRER